MDSVRSMLGTFKENRTIAARKKAAWQGFIPAAA